MENHGVIFDPATKEIQLKNPNGLTGGTPTTGYGLLYNGYAIQDARNIANTDWHIAEAFIDAEATQLYLDPSGGAYTGNLAGGPMKRTELTYWNSPNNGATNTSRFNGKGSGYRDDDGTFEGIYDIMYIWTPGFDSIDTMSISSLSHNLLNFRAPQSGWGSDTSTFNRGMSIRLVKDSTSLTNGQIGSYTGNDGKIYPTICIGSREWLSENLAETKYRNGDPIPEVSENATWSGLTTGALSAYNNDWTMAASEHYLIYLTPSPL